MTPSVYVCITTRDGTIRNDVMAAMLAACQNAQGAGLKVGAGREQFAYGIATCRNKAVAAFLALKQFSHILFVDDDVLLPPDAVIRLAETASEPGRDIVCGPYASIKFTTPRHAHLYVTIVPKGTLGAQVPEWLYDYPDGVVEVAAGGTGCMLIGRHVFEAIPFPWFRWPEKYDPEAGAVLSVSDDMDFCAAAGAKGFRLWADGRARCGHQKLVDIKTLLDGSLQWKNGRGDADGDDGYGSHVGALKAVAKLTPVRTAVEFGSGRFSTPTFLNREHFPDLTALVSLETDREWGEDTRARNPDPRLVLRYCPIADIHAAEVPDADLVMIDCDHHTSNKFDYSARVKLIERYAADPRAVVVVHDSNFTGINPAVQAAPFKYKRTYVPPFGPHTAILSNAVDLRAFPAA
jgi:hypothetical protein